MNDNQGSVFVVGERDASVERLMEMLEHVGYRATACKNLEQIQFHAQKNPLPIVVISPSWALSLPLVEDATLTSCIEKSLVVVVLNDTDLPIAIDLFRAGVADVWLQGIQENELQESFVRLEQTRKLRVQTNDYGEKLETTNAELEKSLRMLKQDQLAGVEVQKSLMPESPLIFSDYEISHSVKPSLYLSGDFVGYNFVLGRYLLFYFADVSGHGASSAFVTVLLRFMIGRVIRRHTTENDHVALQEAPLGLLEHINNQILATDLGKHLTIVAGCLDTHTSMLRYVVGAQLPRPILITEGRAEYLPGKGKPVGIFEDAVWDVQQILLPDRCALVLLSDGVLDLVPDKSLDDKEQTLLRYLADSSENADSLKNALSVDILETPQDDISMCLLVRGM
ncbi:MAG: PP2C family protein-serine/threonine phosphatase [Porticoccaceae bacterium]|nr:PP2C family protein-serine/threonine phosphatase [Porticoccaceae bacterium]